MKIIIGFILLGIAVATCLLLNKNQPKQLPVVSNQNTIQDKSPQDLSVELLEVLDEPRKWRDDQIHAVDWARVLELIRAGADLNQKDRNGRSILERIHTAPTPNQIGIDLQKEQTWRAKVEEELRQKRVL